MAQPGNAGGKKPKGSKNVVLLKYDDCSRTKQGKVYVPNTIEMAKIKKPIRGQYRNVQISKTMDEDMVKSQLQKAFSSTQGPTQGPTQVPTFDLKNERYGNF